MFSKYSKRRSVINRDNYTIVPVIENLVSVEKRTYADIRVSTFKDIRTHQTVYTFVDDVALLLGQKKYASLYGSDYDDFFAEMLSKFRNTPARSMFSGFTDDEILRYVKSRHLQSRSELTAWFDYLGRTSDRVRDEIRSQVDDYIKEHSPSDVSPDTTSSNSNPQNVSE